MFRNRPSLFGSRRPAFGPPMMYNYGYQTPMACAQPAFGYPYQQYSHPQYSYGTGAATYQATDATYKRNGEMLYRHDDGVYRANPPAIRLKWAKTPQEIGALADKLIADSRKTLDEVVAVPDSQRTFANTLLPLAYNYNELYVQGNICEFPQHVSPDKELRDASTEADKKLSAYSVEAGMREDVFKAVSAFAENCGELAPEEQRLLDRTLRDFRRNGLGLPEAQRAEVKAISERMEELGIQFSKNLGEEDDRLLFTKEELDGLPDNFLEGLEEKDGKLEVTLKYPHYFPIMKKCKVEATRKQVEAAFTSRCKEENTAILEELVVLRQRKAELQGYPSHSAFITETRMSKTPEAVRTFLEELAAKLKPLAEKELETLLAFKKKVTKERGETFDGKINAWDLRFYLTMVEEVDYQVDQEQIKPYFPMEKVTQGLLDIYQDLLGLTFTLVPNADVWHEDVTLYSVHDRADGHFIGHFFLDLHPRPGKYGHAACFGLQPGCQLNGVRQAPVAAMVANFTKPQEGRPSLLEHSEVETYFHEFGHVMHQLCAEEVVFPIFAGTSVERDFVEAPSQMLENWVWEKESLLRMSGHYERPDEPLPEELLKKLVAARNANAGLFNTRQIVLGTFDQFIHSANSAEEAKAISVIDSYADIATRMTGVSPSEGSSFPASFGHLAGGYDSQYYGYMWSEVFSTDMFYTRFRKEGVLNPETGKAYRQCILAKGGSRDAADMLRDFLGRDPTQEAFLESKGLSA